MTPDRTWFLDVGQGHAALALSADRALLIDCPAGKEDVVRQQLVENEATLEHIFITHRDLDHCGGIPALLETPGAPHIHMHLGFAVPPQSNAKVRVKAVLSSIFSIVERDGLQLSLGECAGDTGHLGSISWALVSPSAVMIGQAALNDSANRASMMLLLESSGTRVLVTGDADDVAIRRLHEQGVDVTADALLVPHHGAQLTNLDQLLEMVSPSVAIVSVGRVNAYGHPHSTTLVEISATENTRLMCTQVSRFCHEGTLESQACAGSTCIQFGQEPLVLGADAHDERVAALDWPVCLKKALNA